MEAELVGQAFKRKRSGKKAKKRAKENLWHINKDYETMAVSNNKELEVKLVEEKNQVEWKVHVQEKDQVMKKNVDRVIGSQSNEDVKSAYDTNDDSKDIVENVDVSLSSCSSEIHLFSECE